MLLCTTKCCSSTTKCDSSTTLYYKVLLQYYCTTKCYSSATLYYKVPLQCCSDHCSGTTKYHSNTTQSIAEHYSSTTLHYYCVLQSATPVLLCSATPVALLKWSEWERRHRHPGAPLRRGSSCARSSSRLCQSPGTTELSWDLSPWPPACEAGCDTTTPTALWALSETCPHPLLVSFALELPGDTVLQREQLLCTTKCCSSNTVVLRQYYSAQVLLCPTKYCSSTTKKSFSSITQSTTEYYSSTTLYCRGLLQCYSVLQSATQVLFGTIQSIIPVLPCTTKC